jgi:broad-specificity NMP kinase
MKTSSRIIFITGTPGVGKSTFSKLLEKKLPAHLIKISKLVEDKNLFSGIEKKNIKLLI